jgi:hypothetical protein
VNAEFNFLRHAERETSRKLPMRDDRFACLAKERIHDRGNEKAEAGPLPRDGCGLPERRNYADEQPGCNSTQ